MFRATGIPKSQRLASSKAHLRRAFSDIDPVNIYMGGLSRRFSFDPRCHKRPTLKGPVVASVGVSRDLTAIIQLFPVRASAYPAEAAYEFAEKTLPRLRRWVLMQLSKRQTAILGYEELIIEWTGGEHREHNLRFL